MTYANVLDAVHPLPPGHPLGRYPPDPNYGTAPRSRRDHDRPANHNGAVVPILQFLHEQVVNNTSVHVG